MGANTGWFRRAAGRSQTGPYSAIRVGAGRFATGPYSAIPVAGRFETGPYNAICWRRAGRKPAPTAPFYIRCI
ncbi:MAG TPA: hypothetical protein VF276_00035, partial [Chloroflexia bacterium]